MLRAILLACVVIGFAWGAERACVNAYSSHSCSTSTKLATTVVNNIGQCQQLSEGPAIQIALRAIGIDGVYLKASCGDGMTLAFYRDAACTQPLTHEAVGNIYGYVFPAQCNKLVDPAKTTDPDYLKMKLLLTSAGLPPAEGYQAQCTGCPEENWRNPDVPEPVWPDMPSWPSSSPSPTPSGKADKSHGTNGHTHGKHNKGGSLVLFFLLLLLLIGLATACSCYWCTFCPWYQHRMGGGSHMALDEVQVASIVISDSEALQLTDGNPIVAGVPVEDSHPSNSYDPAPHK